MTRDNSVISIKQIKNIEKLPLKYTGEYEGICSGYHVSFKIGKKEFEGKTILGVRGINIPCIVHVDLQGNVTVDYINKKKITGIE